MNESIEPAPSVNTGPQGAPETATVAAVTESPPAKRPYTVTPATKEASRKNLAKAKEARDRNKAAQDLLYYQLTELNKKMGDRLAEQPKEVSKKPPKEEEDDSEHEIKVERVVKKTQSKEKKAKKPPPPPSSDEDDSDPPPPPKAKAKKKRRIIVEESSGTDDISSDESEEEIIVRKRSKKQKATKAQNVTRPYKQDFMAHNIGRHSGCRFF